MSFSYRGQTKWPKTKPLKYFDWSHWGRSPERAGISSWVIFSDLWRVSLQNNHHSWTNLRFCYFAINLDSSSDWSFHLGRSLDDGCWRATTPQVGVYWKLCLLAPNVHQWNKSWSTFEANCGVSNDIVFLSAIHNDHRPYLTSHQSDTVTHHLPPSRVCFMKICHGSGGYLEDTKVRATFFSFCGIYQGTPWRTGKKGPDGQMFFNSGSSNTYEPIECWFVVPCTAPLSFLKTNSWQSDYSCPSVATSHWSLELRFRVRIYYLCIWGRTTMICI